MKYKEIKILIVDDEIAFANTLAQRLQMRGLKVGIAYNGEQALSKLTEDELDVIVLDLKMPGIGGMEVLRRIKGNWPNIRVIIITAHGTIESAVEAMKLGAVDFIQKPFSPKEIRDLTKQVLERETLEERHVADYPSLIALTKRHFTDRSYAAARETAQKAIGTDPTRPEAYNLLGALFEIEKDLPEALKFYRAALDIDPSFNSAWMNIERVTSRAKEGKIEMGSNNTAVWRQNELKKEDRHEK